MYLSTNTFPIYITLDFNQPKSIRFCVFVYLCSDSLIRCESVKNIICLYNLRFALDMCDKQCVYISSLVLQFVTTSQSPQINGESVIND